MILIMMNIMSYMELVKSQLNNKFIKYFIKYLISLLNILLNI
jgi:hypothetical protein